MITKFHFYPTREYTGDPEIELIASCFLYDDNLSVQENVNAVYNYSYAENIKHKLEYYHTTEPIYGQNVFKQLYCKELKFSFGSSSQYFFDYQLLWQVKNVDLEGFPGTEFYGVSFSIGTSIPIYTYTNRGYEFNLIDGSSAYKQYCYIPNLCLDWINYNPSNCESYIKILYSYDEENKPYIRCIITGFRGYVFLTENRIVKYEIYDDMSYYKTYIELEDEEDEDMKIITPNLTELFNRQYICKRGHAYALGNYVSNFPSQGSLLEKINAMLGGFAEWLSTIVDLTIFPFDVSSKVAHSSGVTTIRFSPADLQDSFQNLTFSEVLYPITVRDCLFDGCSWTLISRTYNDFRDFPPYRKSQIYIPYIGIVDLDLTAYYGKYIKIKYAVDISCGGCRAYVCIANNSSVSDDGLIVAQFDGTMGVHCPITDVLWSEHYNSINNALGGAVSGGISSAIEGKPTGALTLPMTAVSAGYELNKAESRVPAQSSGSASSCLNSYTDTSCYMFWYDVDTDETTYLKQLKGYSSNKSGLLNTFTGYLECSDVRLVCGKATESEKTRLVQLLTSGIYI